MAHSKENYQRYLGSERANFRSCMLKKCSLKDTKLYFRETNSYYPMVVSDGLGVLNSRENSCITGSIAAEPEM